MKAMVSAAALFLIVAGSASAQTTCKAESDAKKLTGAARASHMKKCEEDARVKCQIDSSAKKLHGAALTSHMKKCVADAVGT